ncbi:hypothetical protein VW41_10395 [Klebsiella michiganensis]|nr:hypothetical protein VW41_10395 [Klebsiella michiganensis]
MTLLLSLFTPILQHRFMACRDLCCHWFESNNNKHGDNTRLAGNIIDSVYTGGLYLNGDFHNYYLDSILQVGLYEINTTTEQKNRGLATTPYFSNLIQRKQKKIMQRLFCRHAHNILKAKAIVIPRV